ncbi:hypothetical protein R3P38DRAFT_2796014 [Favolaschia claudopus]|uniref:Uncharacterized protein n=1 Tax=Favolaschia claudopus TaxID=2862362 RepID=A0AAW0A5R7_9AGAR
MFVFKNATSTGSLGCKTYQLIPCVSLNGYLAPFGFNGHGNAGNDDYEVLQKLWGLVPMWTAAERLQLLKSLFRRFPRHSALHRANPPGRISSEIKIDWNDTLNNQAELVLCGHAAAPVRMGRLKRIFAELGAVRQLPVGVYIPAFNEIDRQLVWAVFTLFNPRLSRFETTYLPASLIRRVHRHLELGLPEYRNYANVPSVTSQRRSYADFGSGQTYVLNRARAYTIEGLFDVARVNNLST